MLSNGVVSLNRAETSSENHEIPLNRSLSNSLRSAHASESRACAVHRGQRTGAVYSSSDKRPFSLDGGFDRGSALFHIASPALRR